jgi:hypothetical protein
MDEEAAKHRTHQADLKKVRTDALDAALEAVLRVMVGRRSNGKKRTRLQMEAIDDAFLAIRALRDNKAVG